MENENTTSGYDQTISILDIITLLLSKAIWIILAGIIAAAGVGIFTKVAITPTYQSYSTLSVFNRTVSSGNNVSSSEVVAAQYLAETYTHILQSDTVCASVIEELNKKPAYAVKELTPKDLKKFLKVSTLSDTQLLKITITTTDPVFSADIANAFATVAPSMLETIFPIGGVMNLDFAKVENAPVAPNVLKNCVIGFLLGALILSAIYILNMLMDTTIHEVEDIEKFTKLPVLGSMPSIIVTEEQKYTPWKIEHHKVISLDKDTDSI
ncbi:MAG: hypothetical protein E7634_01290 [Ruminococcaceae bacterium]|nr:hypothetical protein [Oscillospiraceae bacterium]